MLCEDVGIYNAKCDTFVYLKIVLCLYFVFKLVS